MIRKIISAGLTLSSSQHLVSLKVEGIVNNRKQRICSQGFQNFNVSLPFLTAKDAVLCSRILLMILLTKLRLTMLSDWWHSIHLGAGGSYWLELQLFLFRLHLYQHWSEKWALCKVNLEVVSIFFSLKTEINWHFCQILPHHQMISRRQNWDTPANIPF